MKRIALLCGALALAGTAAAQTYPGNRPIKLVVPFSAGGNADLTARLIAKQLAGGLKTPVIVENRAGANGTVGLDAVRQAAPDGHTLLVSPSSPLVVNPVLYKKLPYDSLKDFEPISQILAYQYVLVVPADSSLRSLPDLAREAKEKPGMLTYGSSGMGGGGHLAGELLALTLGIELNHIPYKGAAPALADLLGGQLSFTWDTVMTAVPHIQAQKLRPLAVSGSRRAGSLPKVPTMQELGYKNYDVTQFVGLLAPAKTPAAIIERLHAEVEKAVKAPEVIKALKTEGGNELVTSTPAQFKTLIASELDFYRKLVTDAQIKAE
ncbi:tripartite tricarboxylate transporter substrate binding protein [uncultured Pigmentiphaga sp.]|uniref:Bug family tripartite tricarboxylate transporter substrate binding protein n=1 Tax=uncultured Pigmentiphaga sp. TaxID=340361 RepID=UPI0026149870|nr:tripartite tricarboxylate transporter substrate binding protein [uncultured Pigmentiphaga sp.]